MADTRNDEPFVFGTRYIDPEADIFSHNAWDHAPWGPEDQERAQESISQQKTHPVQEFDKNLYNTNPAKYWNIFYKNNKENFFKDRKWLQIEFPSLYKATAATSPPTTIVEVGCGVGNSLFPILSHNKNPNFRIVGADYAPNAINLVKSNPLYDPKHAHGCVWDLSNEEGTLPETVEPNSVDIVILVFVFSALAPNQWKAAVKNISKMMKPGGQILFRDYGRYDLAQVRFKKERYLDENFYVRGDGTRVYFFTEEELKEIFGEFQEVRVATDRRLLVNRKKKLKMYRIWLQAIFEKPAEIKNDKEAQI